MNRDVLHSRPLILVAVGGNSLVRDRKHMTVLDQYRAAGETTHHIATMVQDGYRVVITHGNGPQVGFILLRSELARGVLHQVPLENCVADTQGAIGYQIGQTLSNELRSNGVDRNVVTIVTQVVVRDDDPAFRNPSKPIGPYFSEEDARRHAETEGWTVREDAGRGWRRVVPSPAPLEIVEVAAIRALLAEGMIVIAAGGGGIPVVRTAEGRFEGRDAVVDKDATSCLLAKTLGVETFIITTGVDRVALHFGSPNETPIDRMPLADARDYLQEGHFAEGSMRPKIEAAIDFLEHGGHEVIITQPHHLKTPLNDIFGTHIVS